MNGVRTALTAHVNWWIKNPKKRNPDCVTVREIAQAAGKTRPSVLKWIASGELAASKLDGEWQVRLADWEAYVATHPDIAVRARSKNAGL